VQFHGGNSSNAVHGQEHVQAVVTLRSGKQVDNQVILPEETTAAQEGQGSRSAEKRDAEPSTSAPTIETPPRSFVPKAPYPDRLLAPKKGGKFKDILEVFKQVQISIPFLDAIQQLPSYAKFLKDLITVKRKTNVPKKVCLTEQVSSILQCRLPIKYKDPGCPTISCTIGVSHIEKALLDLGASVNLLPYSIYLQLGLGELKPTSMTLQLRHVISHRGIEVDKAKVDLISNLPPPRTMKEVRSFLGHAGFYRRFIQDFSKIAQPLCKLLVNEAPFIFYEDCKKAFGALKKILTSTPIIRPPSWDTPFEIMCDASDFAVGAVLGQRIDKLPHVIYYASRTLNDAQLNYSTTEKEQLAVGSKSHQLLGSRGIEVSFLQKGC
jgi:hypothetical protein